MNAMKRDKGVNCQKLEVGSMAELWLKRVNSSEFSPRSWAKLVSRINF